MRSGITCPECNGWLEIVDPDNQVCDTCDFTCTTEGATQTDRAGEQRNDDRVVADEKPVDSFIDWVNKFGNPADRLR